MSKETPQFIPPAGQALLNACWPSPGPLPLPLPGGVPPPAAALGLNPLPLPWATALSFLATKRLAPVLLVHRPWTAIARGGHRGASHPGASAEGAGGVRSTLGPPHQVGREQEEGRLSMTSRLPPQGGLAGKQHPPRCCQAHCRVDYQTGPSSLHSLEPDALQPNTCGHLLRAPYRPHTGQRTRTQHVHTHMYSAHTYLYIHMRAYTAHTHTHTTTHARTHLHTQHIPINAQARIYHTQAHVQPYMHI